MSALMTISPSAAEYFGGMARSYDSLIRRAVPEYDEMMDQLIAYLPPDAPRMVELGCGSGNLTLRLAARWPHSTITLVDASAEMVDLAASRLATAHPALAARSRRVVARFEELALPPGSTDVVTSSISLHHVRDKQAHYARLRTAMRPLGRLVFADQFLGHPDHNHRLNWERWLEYCRRPGHCSAEELEGLVAHAQAHDHYVTLVEHVRLLEAAGWGEVDCVWRSGMWGIVSATAI
jgi:tRNA (cmo5U34)-methyltransferase